MSDTTIRLSQNRADEYANEANRVRVQSSLTPNTVFLELMRPGNGDGSVYGYLTADEARELIAALRGALADAELRAERVESWPQERDGKTVWACCVSSIGPECAHVANGEVA